MSHCECVKKENKLLISHMISAHLVHLASMTHFFLNLYIMEKSETFFHTHNCHFWHCALAWWCLYQADNRAVAQLVESIVFVINSVMPLLRKLPQSVVEDLEQDLKQMIVRHSFLTVVHACIKYSTFFSTLIPWLVILFSC